MFNNQLSENIKKVLTKLSPLFHKLRLLRSPVLPSTTINPSPESAFENTKATSASLAAAAAASRSQSSKDFVNLTSLPKAFLKPMIGYINKVSLMALEKATLTSTRYGKIAVPDPQP